MWTQQKVYIDSLRKSVEAQEKKQSKIFCHFMYSGRLFQEVCNNLWKNCAYCKGSVKRASMWVFISFYHLAAKSPVMGYICYSMLHTALLLSLPTAYSGITSQYSLFYPQPSAYLTALNRMGPMQTRQGIALAHRYSKQQAQYDDMSPQPLLKHLKLHWKVFIQQKVFPGRRYSF